MSARGTGSAFFASILLMVAGVVNIIYGLAALDDSKFFVGETRYVVSNLNTWGWITLVLGILAIIAGVSVVRGGIFGRSIGIVVASISAIGALLSIGGAYPFWSLGVFAICIIVIHGLAVYDPETTRTRVALLGPGGRSAPRRGRCPGSPAVSSTPVSRTARSMPSRTCSIWIRLAFCCATADSSPARPPGWSRNRVNRRTRRPAAVSWRVASAASSARSMLPPDRIATVVPVGAGSTTPAISAATPTAPAPSTSSFERSSRNTIASAIVLLVHGRPGRSGAPRATGR